MKIIYIFLKYSSWYYTGFSKKSVIRLQMTMRIFADVAQK